MSTQVSAETAVEPVGAPIAAPHAAPHAAPTAMPSAPPSGRPASLGAAMAGFRMPSIPTLITAGLFALLYQRPFQLLLEDWWNNPEAGHGLLLAPLALYFAYKSGIIPNAQGNRVVGGLLLFGGVFFRYVSDLAAELFTMRGSMIMAAAGLTVWHFGFRQLVRWWLPFALLSLSVPLPEIILNRIALPLQFTASKIGAGLLAWRDIPVMLTGNVINIPGHQLFVAEACSGLRSLTALLSLGVLLGAITLKHPVSRVLLLAIAIPVAIVLNGVRVFLTGFLVFFVDPKLGEGFMHITEGWLIFLVAFMILGAVAWALLSLEKRVIPNAPSSDPFRPEVARA
jgi:exosortase